MLTIGIITLVVSVAIGILFLASVVVMSPQAHFLGTQVLTAMALSTKEKPRPARRGELPRWLTALAILSCAGVLLGLALVVVGLVL